MSAEQHAERLDQLAHSVSHGMAPSSGDAFTLFEASAWIRLRETKLEADKLPINEDALRRWNIYRALHKHEGHRTHAAEELGISVRTLQRAMKRYRIEDQRRACEKR